MGKCSPSPSPSTCADVAVEALDLGARRRFGRARDARDRLRARAAVGACLRRWRTTRSARMSSCRSSSERWRPPRSPQLCSGLLRSTVRERLLLEGRRVVAPPRLRPALLGVRARRSSASTSFGFAMLESTIHWREGLGWHGLSCLLGPVHRDAIPILAGLSLVAVAVHGADRAPARVGAAALRAARRRDRSPRRSPSEGAAKSALTPAGRALLANGPRGPPSFTVPVPCISS